MISRKNIQFLSRKESSIVFIMLTPIIALTIIPAFLIFAFRAFYHFLSRVKHQEAKREEPFF